MPVVEIDCTQKHLAPGIRVASCRRFPGLCVEATRRLALDELVHRYPLHLIGRDTQVRLVTDFGIRHCNLDDHCVEITPESLDGVNSEMLEHLAALTGVEVSDQEEIYRRLTDGGERRFVLAFDDLLNHSNTANMQFVLSPGALPVEQSQAFAWGELYALRAIAPGEELTVDYRTFYGCEWEPPAAWAG